MDWHTREREGSELSFSKRDPYLKTPPFSGYPLVIEQFAIEFGHKKIVDLPIEHGDFPELC